MKMSPNLSETAMVWPSRVKWMSVGFLGSSLPATSATHHSASTYHAPLAEQLEPVEAPHLELFVLARERGVPEAAVDVRRAHWPGFQERSKRGRRERSGGVQQLAGPVLGCISAHSRAQGQSSSFLHLS